MKTKNKPKKRKQWTKKDLNAPQLRQIQAHILEDPRRFAMSVIVLEADPKTGLLDPKRAWIHTDISEKVPDCGTVACIAGWNGLLLGKSPKQLGCLSLSWHARKLGLNPKHRDEEYLNHDKEGVHLFLDYHWPEAFRVRWDVSETATERAQIASDRIDYLIATGL